MDRDGAFLLVATPHAPPEHREALILVAVHGDEGSLGFVVNRPSAVHLGDVFPGLRIAAPANVDRHRHAWRGGATRPDVGWLLFDARLFEAPDDSCLLTADIGVTASPPAMEQIFAQRAEGVALLLGHETWDTGQLDAELEAGRWLRATADPRLVFDVPVSQRWSDATCAALDLPRPWLGAAQFALA